MYHGLEIQIQIKCGGGRLVIEIYWQGAVEFKESNSFLLVV